MSKHKDLKIHFGKPRGVWRLSSLFKLWLGVLNIVIESLRLRMTVFFIMTIGIKSITVIYITNSALGSTGHLNSGAVSERTPVSVD